MGYNFADSLHADRGTYMAYAAFTAIAWLNCIEVFVKVFFIFNRWRGLYFWSILVTVFGIMMNSIGCLTHFYTPINPYLAATLVTVGWWGMVTGQSVVLYSRLHLVVREKWKLRLLLGMICFDAVVFHPPTSVLTLGSYGNAGPNYAPAYSIVERIQVVVFCLQEIILSLTYIWEVRKLLRLKGNMYQRNKAGRVLRHLILINILVILLDFAYVAFQYANLYYMQAGLKAAVYAYQLHLEFTILNQLMGVLGGNTKCGKVGDDRGERRAQFLDKGGFHGSDDSTEKTYQNTSNGQHVSPYAEKYSVSARKTSDGPDTLMGTQDEGVTMTTDVDVESTNIASPGPRPTSYGEPRLTSYTEEPIPTNRSGPVGMGSPAPAGRPPMDRVAVPPAIAAPRDRRMDSSGDDSSKTDVEMAWPMP